MGSWADEASYNAYKLNTSWSGLCDAVRIDSIGVPLLDRTWLADRALHGAIVAGHMESGTMNASQVFVRLPDPMGPCPDFVTHCGEGQMPTYTRTARRCLMPSKCVAPAICPLGVPNCAPGYKRVSWTNATAYVCDPSFCGLICRSSGLKACVELWHRTSRFEYGGLRDCGPGIRNRVRG
jgi:hypothetical protein